MLPRDVRTLTFCQLIGFPYETTISFLAGEKKATEGSVPLTGKLLASRVFFFPGRWVKRLFFKAQGFGVCKRNQQETSHLGHPTEAVSPCYDTSSPMSWGLMRESREKGPLLGDPILNSAIATYLLKTQLFNFLGNMGYMSVKD